MKKLFLLPGIFLLMGLFACEFNRYDSGPATSVFTPRERVTNTWRWKLALQNSENLTGVLKDSTISFTKDQVVRICGADGGCREGSWDLVRKNTKINIIFGDQARVYDIELLRINEMWLRASFTNPSTNIEWDLVPADSLD